jgi:4-hydroxy 2-oxovalerate aldolase
MVKSSQISASINLTSVSAYSQSQLVHGIARLADSQSVDCLYLADSRGALRPSEVSDLISRARAIWTGTLGFHAHDNLGHAIVNSQVAIESGCDLVDGSVKGYGLGGGNADLKGLLETLRLDHLRVLQHNALNKLAKGLNLPRHHRHKQLYQLAGAKNLEQEWVLPLIKLYGKSARPILEKIPRRRYKTLADVLDVKIGNLERTGTG